MGDRRESEGDPEAYSLTWYLYPFVLRTSKVLLYSLALRKMAIVVLLYLSYSTIRYLLAPGQISALHTAYLTRRSCESSENEARADTSADLVRQISL